MKRKKDIKCIFPVPICLIFSLNITPQVSEGPRLLSPVRACVWCLNLEGDG